MQNRWIEPSSRLEAVEKAKQLLDKFLSYGKPSDSGWPEVTKDEWSELHLLIEAILHAKFENDCDGDPVIRFVLVNRSVHMPFVYRPVFYDHKPELDEKIRVSNQLLNMRLAFHDVERYLDERLRELGYWKEPDG